MMQRVGRSQLSKKSLAVIRLFGIAFAASTVQMMFVLPALAAGLQSQSMVVHKSPGAKLVTITVPVRLASLDSRIRYGKMTCGITIKGNHMVGGQGEGLFSINSNDGSFNGNVKVSVEQGNIPDSMFAQELEYNCGLFLSADSHTYFSIYSDKINMLQPKSGSPLVTEVHGNIPVLK
jgi:hypothetical protein